VKKLINRGGSGRTRMWRVLIAVAGFSFAPLSFSSLDALAFPSDLSFSLLLAGLALTAGFLPGAMLQSD